MENNIFYKRTKISLFLQKIVSKFINKKFRLADKKDISDILKLYHICNKDLVLSYPKKEEEIANILNQFFISVNKKTFFDFPKIIGLIEFRTLQNGGLTQEKIREFTSNPGIIEIDARIKKLYNEEINKLVYFKRVLTHPDYRKKRVSSRLKIALGVLLWSQGYRYVTGIIRIYPKPNNTSLKVHLQKDESRLVGTIHQTGEDGQDYIFGIFHYDLRKQLFSKIINGI